MGDENASRVLLGKPHGNLEVDGRIFKNMAKE
jgi:hypothetical protein